ncbi:nuclear transport factor 2 family protein [Xylanimonas oleitrophica]|uniref:Nuclear transport factor 2 family protein n=1 Tax=Xylanimonas oleitrophica TaxID=2607479 RepID=A0A2W5WQA7_9MICO|nr:nuclear transport factor 2 family protein [Xylanimonas oleitrophica]PZR53340.1 nuclear transport factor 2 family protein [Xylanimonas oleitrophica]
MSSTAEITNLFLQRLGAQDAEGIGELFAEEIDWHVHGDPELTPWVGPRSRKSEVPGYFRTLWAALVPGRSVVTVEAVVVDGDEAVVFAVFDHVAAPTGRPFHTDVALRLTVTDGAITRMHLFEDTAAVAAAFAA